MAPEYVFLSHNSEDKPAVREVATRLKRRGFKPWLDDEELIPGRPFQDEIDKIIRTCQAGAVFVGPSGIGPWEREETRALLSQAVKRGIPVLPVLLPGVPKKPELPVFLEERSWVDLREGITRKGLARIVWGITGKKPKRWSLWRQATLASPVSHRDRVLVGVEMICQDLTPKGRRIALKLEECPDAVDSPLAMWQKTPRAPAVHSQESIGKLFQERVCNVLILGDQGSGKTTTLLLLARDLAARAQDNPNAPIPVFLHLSTWSEASWVERQLRPFSSWLVKQIRDRYRVGTKMPRIWLKQSLILPLLDGLDQVADKHRADCVDAINAWLRNKDGVPGIAVCCGSQANEKLRPRLLQLTTAAALLPLSASKIAENSSETLQGVLAKDDDLRELAKTPELLTLMEKICAKEGHDMLTVSAGLPLVERRKKLFGDYVESSLKGRPSRRYPKELTLRALTWLARRMKEHSSYLFQLEQLQPSWLTNGERWAYFLITRALSGLLLGASLAVLWESSSLIGFGLATGALLGVFDKWMGRLRRSRAGPPHGLRQGFLRSLAYGAGFGGVAYVPLRLAAATTDFPSVAGPLSALLFGLVLGLRSALRDGSRDIEVAEQLAWSGWSGRGAALGAIVGGTGGALTRIPIGFVAFLAFGTLIGGLLGALQGRVIDQRSRPNEGMWMTLKSTAVLLVAVFLVVSPVVGAVIFALQRERDWDGLLRLAPLLGAMFGFWVALWFSGLDVLQHFVLRALLRIRGHAPAGYVRFLNDAADAGLLLRSGGIYRFFYELPLLEHFKGEPAAQSAGIARSASS